MDSEKLQYQYVEEEIDLQHYLSLLRRNLQVILSVVIIAASLASIYAFKLPNIYESETQVLIQKEQEAQSYVELKAEDTSTDVVYYNTQIEIIRSVDLISKAVTQFKLVDPLLEMRKIKYPKDAPEEQRVKTAVGIVKGGLDIARVKDTRIFNISYSSTDRLLCKEVSNAVAKAYVKQHVEEKLYVPKELLQFFPEDGEKIQSQTALGQLQEISQGDMAKTLPSVVNDPLIRGLRAKAAEAEAELLRLQETYKPKHPKIVEAKSTLKFIQDRIKIETENIIRNLKTSLTSQLQVSTVRILREGDVPGGPVGPNRMRIVMMATLGALLVICGIVFVIDFLDDTIKTQEDIEKFIQLPFLGHIPLFKEKMKDVHQKAFAVHYDPLSEISESFRFVKVAINFSGAPGSLKCLLVTSTIPSEGKSWFSSNLAASFLRDGEKVLMVDADLRHPTVHLHTNTENLKGLSNYLTSNLEIGDIIQKTAIPQLDVIAAGPLSPNPTELFSSYRMENFIKDAKSKYDRVVIDSPPITGLADSLVIGTKTDGVVLLIEARRISRNPIKKAKQRMLETGVKVLGVVINKVNLERDVPSYRYYAYSYRYYGKKKDQAKKDDAVSQSG